MKTTAIRLHGEMDLRIGEIDLPRPGKGELLMRVVADSVCASTYKAVKQGSRHKRVPEGIEQNPVIIGHEMCGEIVEVGEGLEQTWRVGQKIVIQPALKLESGFDPGYSYTTFGGNTVYTLIPQIALERGCVIPYNGEGYFEGALVEPLGCILRGFKGFYHTDYSTYVRTDGAKRGGKLAILGGAGPMGIGAILLAVGYAGVSEVVVTDINDERLADAERKCTPAYAASRGCKLTYVNTANIADPTAYLLELSEGGFDDVFVMVPVAGLFTMAERICREDGCVNFFAGPPVHDLQGSLNLYRVHYDGIHLVGTAGSIPSDTTETLELIENGSLKTSPLVSHILGLRAVPEAIFAMERPDGAKKVCYNELDIPLVAIDDLAELGKTDPLYGELAKIVAANEGLWCVEAERYLLAHAPRIQ